MCVNRSGYYTYLKSLNKGKNKNESLLLLEVKLLDNLSRGSYGTRQIAKNLQSKGYQIGRYRARTLMRKAGVECKQRRRYRITTDSKHKMPVAENILNREFKVTSPNLDFGRNMMDIFGGFIFLCGLA